MTKLQLKEGENLVCFGTGEIGEEFATLCKEKNIPISYFSDNDKNKWGRDFCGVPVLSLDALLAKGENLVFLISNVRYQDDIMWQLKEAGIKQIYFSTIEKEWISSGHMPTHLLAMFLADRHYNLEQKRNPEGLFLSAGSINLIRDCTLNCNHCFAQVPYLTTPDRLDKNVYEKMVDLYSDVFDCVRMLKLSGGEAMLHPDLYNMIRYATAKENILQVTLFSNSTLLLKEEELSTLDKTKVRFFFSRYGNLNVKMEENKALLEKYHIPYFVLEHDFWIISDIGVRLNENSSEEVLTQRFGSCKFIKDGCAAISKQHFHLCHMSYTSSFDQKIPEEYQDWVNVDRSKRSLEDIKKDIKSYLSKDYLEICKCCSGVDVIKEKKVPVGEQIKGKLTYEPGKEVPNIPLNELYAL